MDNNKKKNSHIEVIPMTTAEEIDRMRAREYDEFVERHGKFDFDLFYREVIEDKRCEHSSEREA